MRILALTNLYPNPYQPLRAPFNRQLFRALNRQTPFRLISPIAWTDELVGRRSGGGLPRDRKVTLDGMVIEHPVYYTFPKSSGTGTASFTVIRYGRAFAQALRRVSPRHRVCALGVS